MSDSHEPRDFEPPTMPGSASAEQDPRPRQSPDELVTGEDRPHSHRRLWITAAVAVLVLVLIVAGLLIWGPGSPFRPTDGDSSPSASVSTGPLEPPPLPERFDNYVRQVDASPSADPTEGDDLAAATAVYTVNGQPAILLIGARPVTEMSLFLLSLGATDPAPVGDGWCALYGGESLCGVQRDDTAWVVSPLTDLTDEDLLAIAASAAAA